MEEEEKVKISGGILLLRSKSGTSKIQKVLVLAKRGKEKNQVKCRLQKFGNEKKEKRPSKIPVLVKTRKRGVKKGKTLKSLHPSASNLEKKEKSPKSCSCSPRKQNVFTRKKTQIVEAEILKQNKNKSTKKKTQPESRETENKAPPQLQTASVSKQKSFSKKSKDPKKKAPQTLPKQKSFSKKNKVLQTVSSSKEDKDTQTVCPIKKKSISKKVVSNQVETKDESCQCSLCATDSDDELQTNISFETEDTIRNQDDISDKDLSCEDNDIKELYQDRPSHLCLTEDSAKESDKERKDADYLYQYTEPPYEPIPPSQVIISDSGIQELDHLSFSQVHDLETQGTQTSFTQIIVVDAEDNQDFETIKQPHLSFSYEESDEKDTLCFEESEHQSNVTSCIFQHNVGYEEFQQDNVFIREEIQETVVIKRSKISYRRCGTTSEGAFRKDISPRSKATQTEHFSPETSSAESVIYFENGGTVYDGQVEALDNFELMPLQSDIEFPFEESDLMGDGDYFEEHDFQIEEDKYRTVEEEDYLESDEDYEEGKKDTMMELRFSDDYLEGNKLQSESRVDEFFDFDTYYHEPEVFLGKQKSFIVMAQYQSTPATPQSPEGSLEGVLQELPDEEFEIVESDDESGEYEYEYLHRYIDSGLRPLKSDESKLYLNPVRYRSKSTVPPTYDDDVQPLLQEIPSDIFEKPKIVKKKKSPTKVIEKEPSVLSQGDYKSSEEEEEEQPHPEPEPKPPDDQTLKVLEEFEDVVFTIETDDLKKKEQEEFCVHTKDVPGAESFSSFGTTDDSAKTTEKKKRSIFRFFRKEEFCVHTHEPPGSDNYSLDESSGTVLTNRLKTLVEEKRRPSETLKEEIYTVKAPPKPRFRSKSKQSEVTTSGSTSSSLYLMSNKERRRSRIQSLGSGKSSRVSELSLTTRTGSSTKSKPRSGLLLMDNKSRRHISRSHIL